MDDLGTSITPLIRHFFQLLRKVVAEASVFSHCWVDVPICANLQFFSESLNLSSLTLAP